MNPGLGPAGADTRSPLRRCPLCEGEAPCALYHRATDWQIVRCPRCGFAWVEDFGPTPPTAFDWAENIVEESGRRAPMYRDRLRRIERFSPMPRRWLDVGCGGGGLLKCVAAHGYDVEGVEPSPSAPLVTQRLGIRVHQSSLAEALPSLSSDDFGIISYFHVLEHVIDPLTELALARSRLAPAGLLAVEVPFFDSPLWRVVGHRHRHCQRPHRSYFTPKSLRVLLERAGFTPLVFESVPYAMTVGWLLMRIGSWTNPLRQLLPDAIARLVLRLRTGEYLLAIARKDPDHG